MWQTNDRDGHGVHVVPLSDERKHNERGTECWCEPKVQYIDPDDGLPYPNGPLVVHRDELDRLELE